VVRRVIHNALVIDKYRYGERFSHHEIKISHCTINPPAEYKQVIVNQFSHCEISRKNAKERVANLGDFSLKANLQFLWEL
jgi:hypothetical protein